MEQRDVRIGARVRAVHATESVPEGAHGVIDEIFDTGFMVAWDLPGQPLPPGYQRFEGKPPREHGLVRDGFGFGELADLEVIE